MRASVLAMSSIFLLCASNAFGLTTLTQSQVQNVCGKDLKNVGSGNVGCSKKCADGKSTCLYSCSNKTGNCSGQAIVKTRTISSQQGAKTATGGLGAVQSKSADTNQPVQKIRNIEGESKDKDHNRNRTPPTVLPTPIKSQNLLTTSPTASPSKTRQ
jgi:hypothetical protein